jgi:hypothetical protein
MVYFLLIAWAVVLLLALNSVRKKVEPNKKIAFYLLVFNVMLGLFCTIMAPFNDKYPLGFTGFLVLMGFVIPTFSYIFYVALKFRSNSRNEDK